MCKKRVYYKFGRTLTCKKAASQAHELAGVLKVSIPIACFEVSDPFNESPWVEVGSGGNSSDLAGNDLYMYSQCDITILRSYVLKGT